VNSGSIVAILAGIGSSVLALLCAPVVALAQAEDREPMPLSLEHSSSATQRADEPIVYRFAARAGQSYFIEVDQRGLDFIVAVQSPDGGTLPYNSPSRRDEREYAVLHAGATGDHLITVVSNEQTNATGRHSIRVMELSTVTRTNPERSQAWALMTTAAAINAEADRMRLDHEVAQQQVDALKKSSRDAYAQARDLWEKLGESRLQAQALYSMAMLEYWDLENWTAASDLAERAANLYRGVDDELDARARLLQACALVVVAGEMDRDAASATFEITLETFADLATRYEKRDDVRALAEVLNLIGYTQHLRGNVADAEPAWQRSASLFSSVGEWREELNARQNLAVIAAEQGYLGKTIDTFRYILEQIPAGKDQELEANVLENLGAVHRDFGDIDEALQAYSDALNLRETLGDGTHVSASLRGLGSTYYIAGEYEAAKTFLQRALEAARDVGDGRSEAAVLTYLGNIAFLENDYDSALALHQGAERLTNSALDRAVRQLLIAKDLAASGRHLEALATAEAVAASSGDSPVVLADAHTQIGRSHAANDEYSAAAEHLQQALSLYRSLRLQEGEADALNGLAVAARGAGNLPEAVAYGEAALDRIESLRVKVSAPELRAMYSASQRSFYETQIELLMPSEGGDSDEQALMAALSVSERARARMLVDLLASARVDTDQTVDATLAARRSRLQEDLAARSRQRDQLLAGPLANAKADAQLAELLQEMAALENELTLLDTRTRAGSTLPSSLLTGQEIQRLIDPDAVLLQYELGQHRSFVWVVTHDSVHAVELAPRDAIEAAARRALASLQTSTSAPASRNAALQALADHVLTPVAHLVNAGRVLVSADGAMHYVPFAVLPLIRDGVSAALIGTHEVVNVPSMSALVAQRAQRSAESPSKTLAVFADPVFESTDERLTRAAAIATEEDPDLVTRSSVELRRLRYSGREARDIAALVPETGRLVSEGFHANRDEVLNADLKLYRYVHFATHGLVDSRYPALSALALSQFDQRGNPIAGFLRLDDIYDLDLNADLVVLSACDTALGREIRGEGLVGLTQAFLYAGTKGLALSLWQVSDAATAALMTRFYEHMIKDGASAAEALRAAQLSMAADPRWANPYYWGAFVLVGDVR
jgi:CHAT domain-containing protein